MLTDERCLQFGYGADDGEYGPAHRATGVHLILTADEAHPEVVQFLQGSDVIYTKRSLQTRHRQSHCRKQFRI